MRDFDYVIVGGGSAGCVLANRLSEDNNVSVCLIETGPKDNSEAIHTPALFAFILNDENPKYVYPYETVPQKEFSSVTVTEGTANLTDSAGGTYQVPQEYQTNRRGYQPRGKTLGGSSSVNAMLYIRGHKWDYDHWASLGNEGWSYDDVLPYFKKAEGNEQFKNHFHNDSGPLNVAKIRNNNPFVSMFIEAGTQHYKYTDDFNGEDQEGIGRYQVTQKNGRRWSTAAAYLNPARARPNLTILTETTVDKVIFENKTAKAVKCLIKGVPEEIRCAKEVLLCGGAYGSPTLLQRSGVGNRAFLESKEIECIHELNGVGENLQDHIDYITSHRVDSWSLMGSQSLKFILRAPFEVLRYILTRTGMFSSPIAEGGAFLKTSEDLEAPDIQLHFAIGMIEDHGRKKTPGNGFSCHVCLLRPKSVGTVRIASKDPLKDPEIDPQFLSNREDMSTMIKGYKVMMKILNTEPLNQFSNVLDPVNINDDKAIESAIRARSDTIYHPIGTCKMGNDGMAVVDTNLRVHGLSGIRVVDASIMPTLVGGNTNAPTIMIAEKAADIIKEQNKL